MAAEGIVVQNARQETYNVGVSGQGTPSVESPQPPSSFETPRASSVSTPKSSVPSSVRSTPAREKQSVSKSSAPSSVRSTPAREKPVKYVSKMAKAREERKRREAANNSDKSTTSSDMETSSNPSTESGTMSVKSHAPVDKLGNLPKFGEWNKHSANSGPCYTLLFQNAAQEKKIGGPIRVHAPSKESQLGNEDLYRHDRVATMKPARKKTSSFSLLCCFTASESS